MKRFIPVILTLAGLIFVLYYSQLSQTLSTDDNLSDCRPMLQNQCEINLRESGQLTVKVTPYPFHAEQEHQMQIDSELKAELKSAELIGIDMNMGIIPLAFEQLSDNQIQIKVTPASCVNPNMQWRLKIQILINQQNIYTFIDFPVNH
ncbi:hypothetical protein N7931_02720 [Catenovulum sp. 2E275]|uniref:hypothetical protein n=1 Tax=Catenovulum sp. 2E275 TaxID=2980497 RepID=UPI0021D07739|nr:hypothetical protein [Catenovulum sp. 2E275]MCU4674535.1 hypothetical protein [Catenovulum sp. 2E275]